MYTGFMRQLEKGKITNDLKDCGHNKAPPHTCPFQEEIYGHNEIYCTCCPECEQQCLEDI